MGVWELGATDLVSALRRRLSGDSGDPRSASFLKQLIIIRNAWPVRTAAPTDYGPCNTAPLASHVEGL